MSIQSQFSCTTILALIFTILVVGLLLFTNVGQSASSQSGPAVQATTVVVTASSP